MFLPFFYFLSLTSWQIFWSAMCKWDTVSQLRLCGVKWQLHMLYHKPIKTPFCDICLVHSSTALLTHVWLPIPHDSCVTNTRAKLFHPTPNLRYYLACRYTVSFLFTEFISFISPGCSEFLSRPPSWWQCLPVCCPVECCLQTCFLL